MLLITIEQLWIRYPDVIAPYIDDAALIMDQECVISISSIIELIPPPAIILTIDNYRLHPIEATVCIILCACMIITMKGQHLIKAHKCLFILLYLFTFYLL